jgi:shikimate kinase
VLSNGTLAQDAPQAVRADRFLSGTLPATVDLGRLLDEWSTRYRTEPVLMGTQLSPLRVALVGMSGAGKTFWAKRLAESGRPRVSCDDRIEERLRPRLAAGGYTGTPGVAAWMGWPDSPTYAERESEYLAEEIGALDELLTELERNSSRELVLDTTGSVIYTGNNLLMRLRRQMTVVHLAASAAEQQLLIERYLNDPKPVLWRGAFQPKKGETPLETVARCYPALINARRQSYVALAHCTLSVAELRETSSHELLDATQFLEKIRQQLAR